MRITKKESVRGLGRFYVRIGLEGIDNVRDLAEQGMLHASARCGEFRIPARLRPYRPTNASAPMTDCVLDLPETCLPQLQVRIWVKSNHEDYAELNLTPSRLVWESRLNYRLHRHLADALREGEKDYFPDAFNVGFAGYFDQDEGFSWRISVAWQSPVNDRPVRPRLVVLGERGEELEAQIHALESEEGVEAASGSKIDRALYSLIIPGNPERFCVCAHDPAGEYVDGFCCMDERYLEELRGEYRQLVADASNDPDVYRAWLSRHQVQPSGLALQKAESDNLNVTFSIVIECSHSNATPPDETALSVLHQSYPHWELLITNASPAEHDSRNFPDYASDKRVRHVTSSESFDATSGDYIAFLGPNDVLEPDALFRYAKAISAAIESPQVLYCDEDIISQDGQALPLLKPDFSPDLLYSFDYVGNMLAMDRGLLTNLAPAHVGMTSARRYELVLQAFASGASFLHVAHVLYHRRDNNQVQDDYVAATQKALEGHFAQRGIPTRIEPIAGTPFNRVHYALPENPPLVSVIIPSKDHAELLEPCVTSLFEKATYPNLEVVLVENGSVEPRTEELYQKLVCRYPGRVVIARWTEAFNYSSLINFGVRHATGDYLLLLNNDTKIIAPNSLNELVGVLQRPEVGVVGAKLYYIDGLIQHAGMVVGAYDALVHVNQYLSPQRPGYLSRAILPNNYSSVTGACQMVRRQVFEELGGYDETFAVGFNDADFCLRAIRAGYYVTFTPFAELYHYEFASRGRDHLSRQKQLRWKREQAQFIARWPEYFVERDPFSNPNLSRDNLYFALG